MESFFDVSISVVVGDGWKDLFWSDKWIQGTSIRSIAPNLWGGISEGLMYSHCEGWYLSV
jgi:hypothetical protein